MNTLIKSLIIAVAGIAFFALALVVALLTVMDPDRYRGVLENTVERQSSLQLQIAGDMAWTFRPVFGLSIGDVRLRNPASPQELASLSRMSLRVDLGGLFRGELNIEELLAEELHLNWIIDSEGQRNWPSADTFKPAVATEPDPTSVPIAINIRQIRVSDGSLSVRNMQGDSSMTLQNIDLVSINTNLNNRPFELSILMDMVDDAGRGKESMALTTTARIDFNNDSMNLDSLTFHLSPLTLTGNVSAANLRTDPTWQASLRSNTFPLPHLLANFMVADENTLPLPDQQLLSIDHLDVHGDSRSMRLQSLALELGGAQGDRVSLDGNITYAQSDRPLQITYALSSAAIDLDRWLPPARQPTEQNTISTVADIALPIDVLRNMNVRGAHTISQLTVAGLQFSPLQFGLVVENGQLNLDTQSAGFYGGDLQITVRLNARNTPARLAVTSEFSDIEATNLTADLPRLNFFTGRFDLNSTHVMSGNSVNALVDSITGSSRILVSESSVNIAILKQTFSAVSVLSPGGDMTSSWPDVVPINRTEAVLNFSNGLSSGQAFALRMDNLDIAGTGGINRQAGTFDYQLGFTILGEPALQTIAINESYRDIAWPIRCNAAFTDSPARYCSPDLQQVRDMFAQIARGEIERLATDAVGEQVDRVRERLRNLLP
jgi:AsmA protein